MMSMDDKKKKRAGFTIAMALKPKDDDEEPKGFEDEGDEDEPDMDKTDEGDDPEAAMADAGRAFREAMKGDDDLALANAVAAIMDLHDATQEK